MCSDAGDRTKLRPGFPIRKSSDQRSVASYSRLIAGSYVLHRLLVPRHSPYALTNLTTDTKRCSRPLCSSQATNGPGTHPDAYPHQRAVHRSTRPPTPHTRDPPPGETRHHGATGPRSRPHPQRARSLRTQQCAEPPPHPPRPFHPDTPAQHQRTRSTNHATCTTTANG